VANLRIKTPAIVSDLTAWLAFLSGALGSFAATGTFIGAAIGKIASNLPIYIIVPAAGLGFLKVLYDLIDDGVPNRLSTIYITILWPSVLLGAQGKGAHNINGWIKDMNTNLDDKVGPWVSDNPNHTTTHTMMTIIALMFLGCSLYSAHRYYRGNKAVRGAGAGRTTAGTTSAAGAAIIANRKGR
jgi:hypothetical protein